MNAIMSFWTEPMFRGLGDWQFFRDWAISWALSSWSLRQLFGSVTLYTDQNGKTLICDLFKIPFERVDLSFDSLDPSAYSFWTQGKIFAASLAPKPFIHVDFDSFVWQMPPPELMEADIFCQRIGQTNFGDHYKLDELEKTLTHIPDLWFQQKGWPRKILDCGMFGGSNPSIFEDHWSAVKFCTQHASEWTDTWVTALVSEEYLIACAAAKAHAEPVAVTSMPNDFFTHMIQGAKWNSVVISKLRARARKEIPQRVDIINDVLLDAEEFFIAEKRRRMEKKP